MLGRTIIALALIFSLSFAIDLVSPEMKGVKTGDVIDLGTIGPGQTVSLLIDREVTTGGIHGEGGFYDMAVVADLPSGWATKESKLYQDPLQVTITADPNATEGEYSALVKVIDENNGEELGNVTFIVNVRITYDVMDFDVTPTYLNVGPGQPARFSIKITNKGSTSDVFDVSATGAKKWDFVRPVFIPAQTTKTIPYEIVGSEEETYRTTINVVSKASPIIADQKNVTLFVKSDLIGDYKATNNGVMVFPIFEAQVYALAGLISNLFG
ncbi:hypothetical protein H0O00_03310 [Candidatus Micrarchaeota archaeon]|nr:hypothetical protein [Candidatus Micrarchaeota archaeon]